MSDPSAPRSKAETREPARAWDGTRQRQIDEIGRLLQQLTRLSIVGMADQLSAHGLTILQFSTLQAIDHAEHDMTIGEIGEAISAPASSLTGIVDRLEQEGLVTRQQHPADRRAVVVRITPAGAALTRAIQRERRQGLDVLLHGLDETAIAQFTAILTEIVTNFPAESKRASGTG